MRANKIPSMPAVSSHRFSLVQELFNEGKKQQSIKVFLERPNKFDACFLISKKNCFTYDEYSTIFNSIPEKEKDVQVLVSMLTVCRRLSKEDMKVKLLREIEAKLIPLSEESLCKLYHTSWNIIISSMVSIGNMQKEAKFWFEKVKSFDVKFDEITLRQLFYMFKEMELPNECHLSLKAMNRPSVSQYSMLMKLFITQNRVADALGLLNEMKSKNIESDDVTYIVLLKAITERKMINEGEHLHAITIKENISSLELSTSFINFYTKCKKPEKAFEIFTQMKDQSQLNIITWSCVIQALVEMKKVHEGIEMIQRMEKFNIQPTEVIYSVLLTGCANNMLVKEGEYLHSVIEKSNFSSLRVNNCLLNFYTKVGKPEMAVQLFQALIKENEANIITWSCVIQALVEMKKVHEGIEMIQRMKKFNIQPTEVIYVVILTGCANNMLIKEGEQLHSIIEKSNFSSLKVNNCLLNFYTKVGKPEMTVQLFKQICISKKETDTVTWSCAIQSLIDQKLVKYAVSLLFEMHKSGVLPNAITFTMVLRSCIENSLVEEGKLVYNLLRSTNIISDSLLSYMIEFLAMYGSLEQALEIFMNTKVDCHSFSLLSLAKSFIEKGKVPIILNVLETVSLNPLDEPTIALLLTSCADNRLFEEGVKIQSIIQNRKISSPQINNCLMNFYTKCGNPEKALEIFYKIGKEEMTVVTWSCAIQALVQLGKVTEAVGMIERMKTFDIDPNEVTFGILITSCADNHLYEEGVKIHSIIQNRKISSPQISNCLINFYTKSGRPDISLEIFNTFKKEEMTVVTWSCAIQALVQLCKVTEAVGMLKKMELSKIQPNEFIFVILLTACANSGSIDQGEYIFQLVSKQGIVMNEILWGAAINFYCRIGNLKRGEDLFEEAIKDDRYKHNTSIWNAIIDGFAKHGKGKETISIFKRMIDSGVKVSEETFTSVLTGCSHSGLVEEAKSIYASISDLFGLQVTRTHQSCMIDTLGRSGYLEEAEELIGDSKEVIFWSTLLGSCRKFIDVKRAERVFNKLVNLDKNLDAPYVLMANLYQFCKDRENSERIKQLMKDNGVKKIPGITRIEINGVTHQFTSDDQHHPQIKEIREELVKLNSEMLQAGYIPDTRWVTRTDAIDEKQKLELLSRHSEKLALSFAFISLPKGSKITLYNNLRVCGDCHNAIKFISKIRNCEIVVRDASRYHIFKDGKCSCNDFF